MSEDSAEIDVQVLAETFAKHRDRLWRAVKVRLDRRLVGRVDPDDVLQEAYLDASRRLGHYRPGEASLFLWLRLIVSQTLVDTHRRHLGSLMRDASREVGFERAGSAGASSAIFARELAAQLTPPSQAAIRAEMVDRLESALEGMNTIDREILVMRHFEELSNGEAAQVLGIQPKAASIRYVRAAARLKELLARFPEFLDDSH